MRSSYCVKIAGEVQVDVRHWRDLGIAATGSPALSSETWTKRRFAQRKHCFPTNKVERIGETNRGRCLAFTSRCRVDCSDQNKFSGTRFMR